MDAVVTQRNTSGFEDSNKNVRRNLQESSQNVSENRRRLPLQEGQQPTPNAWQFAEAGTVPVTKYRLPEKDESERRQADSAAGQGPPYCVDELCACDAHACDPRNEMVPTSWEQCKKKYGLPDNFQIPPNLFYATQSDTRDFSSEYRAKFGPKPLPASEKSSENLEPPPFSGSPENRDFSTENRSEFTAKNLGKEISSNEAPPEHHQYSPQTAYTPKVVHTNEQKTGPETPYTYKPAPGNRSFTTEHRAAFRPNLGETEPNKNASNSGGYHYTMLPETRDFATEYRSRFFPKLETQRDSASDTENNYTFEPTPETRDFSTEHRATYTKKELPQDFDSQIPIGPHGIPVGVDPDVWNNYVANFHKNDDACPITKLPEYPPPKWPREHTFWDTIAKKWY